MAHKIGIYQSAHEYPALHIMITDNDRYFVGRKCYDDVESAAAAIKKWLEVKYSAPQWIELRSGYLPNEAQQQPEGGGTASTPAESTAATLADDPFRPDQPTRKRRRKVALVCGV